MSPSQRLTANVEALEVLRNLMREGREATPEEREILGRYRGWGGVDIIDKAYSTDSLRYAGRYSTESRDRAATLKRLADVIDELDPDEKRGVLSAIRHAALTSFYTPTAIARVMNRFMELAGFKGGSMLDPSMGNGIFEGTMSKGVQQRTMIHGIELDWLTGQLARHLYPDANVLVTGYEDAGTADNAYDIVISNIPFGQFGVTDKSWKHDSSPVRKAAQNRIHNYFAVKMLDNTRPGGLCVVMTSNAILDTKGNQIIREHLADNAEILGIVRLPDNTFKGAGTSVVTDVIFMRKYKDDADRAATRGDDAYVTATEQPFLSSGEMKLTNPTDGKTYQVTVNGYFLKNKGMMIGDAKAGGQYRGDEFGLTSTMSTDELASAMSKLIDKKIVGDRKGKLFDTHKTAREVHQAVSEAYKGDGTYISSGNIVEQDGMIGIVTSTKGRYGEVSSTFTEMPSLKGKANRIRAMIPIRKAMKQVIDMQIQGESEKRLAEARAELQKAYDDFVKKFGRLNDKENDFLTEDIDGFQLRALERYKGKKFDGLSDIFTKNTIKPALDLTTARTPHDAISLSLAEYGEINPAYMEDILGSSWVEQCGGTLFKTPFTDDAYETADAYLSGDVKTKLEQAREAAKQDPTYQRNVEALEAVQPKDIPFTDINIRMGARWIPAEIYTDFMNEMFGIRRQSWRARESKSGVSYLPEADQFIVNVDKKELGGEADAWRTSRLSPSEIFAAALEDKTRRVYDTIEVDGVERKVINKEETELANNKIQDLRTMFEDWLSQNPEREEMLMRLYNDKFNRTVLRKFDGSHLNVAGLMGKELRPHQKDAVWMLINNRGGIVDHIVGAGKTLVMQSAIMEMRRMGIAKKPMIIALKATVGQIAKEFREAFPAARILAPTERDFEAKNRKKLLAQIAVNDYDCVILSHDNYNQLPHTEEVERAVIDEQMSQLDAAIEYLYGTGDKSQLTKKQIKGLEKRKANLEAKLKSLLDRKIDREFTFEGLGVDYLFVDECQHYKSLPYVSTYDRVAGLGDKKGSQRAVALLNGVRYLQKLHQGDRGTVFLSGTTISNSLSEIYHLLNYLRPSELQRMGLTTFDAWAGNFAVHTAELEYGVTNELKEKDRFRSLTNIPELSKMYAEIADVRNDLNLKLPKPKMRSHVVTVPQSDIMQEINREIVNMVKNKDGSYFGIDSKDTTPWGLLASTLSAKAAINPRLIDDTLDDEGGKIPAVCENVKKIYDQFKEQKGTQLIFCDTGVPGKGKKYDAYSDIINRLVNDYGIPRKEIADIHEAGTDEKRKELFAKVNDGSVRILIGGTKNMGTGVNVQKRIVAMHHVDVPWTPADREQREGRGVRQGNEIARDFNDENVDVYFYATEGSLDMYKYQLQETKGKLFAQFKSGTIGERTFDEGDAEGDFDPAEVVAMLSGNPVIFEKSKQDKKVEKLRRAKRAYESDWQRRRSRYEELQQKKRNFERLLSLNASDVRDLERGGFTPDEEGKYPTTVTVSVKDDYSSRRTFDKPKEAGEYIHSLLKQGKKVQLTGFNQKANITVPITDAGLFGKPVAELDSYGGIKYTVEVSDDDTAAGVAFRNLLQKVYSNRKVYERNLEDVNNQLKGADPGENKFPKQAELDEALKEKKRLDDEYKKLSDEEPKADENKDGGLRFRDDEYDDDIEQDSTMQEDRTVMERELDGDRGDNGKLLPTKSNIDAVATACKALGLQNVHVVTDTSGLQGRAAMAKGRYVPSEDKIEINLTNNRTLGDAFVTALHEGTVHQGLRHMLGDYFNDFLDNVYDNAADDVKVRIDEKQKAHPGWSQRHATEEYMADMTDGDNYEEAKRNGFWDNVKRWFTDAIIKLLKKAGCKLGFKLTDEDIRHIIWASREHMRNEGHISPIVEAEDIAMQHELRVGNFADERLRPDSERRKERAKINRIIDETTSMFTIHTLDEARQIRKGRELQRKQKAKEIYDKVLKGDFSDVTLRQINDFINDVTPNNPYGRRLSERLPQRVERKMYQGRREASGFDASKVDALFSRICESAVPANGRFGKDGRRKAETIKEKALKGWAMASGCWYTDFSTLIGNNSHIRTGHDSEVYLSKDGNHVIKLSRGKFDAKFPTDLDAVNLFNYVFPNTAYRIIGYGEKDGHFVKVLEQPFVDFNNSQPLAEQERVDYMQILGFSPINADRTTFSNGKIVVSDLQKSNIVRDTDGNVRVIDADVKLHTRDIGGSYSYLPVEHDLPNDDEFLREGDEDTPETPEEPEQNPDEQPKEGADEELKNFDAGHKTLGEIITDGLIEASKRNKDNLALRIEAMKSIGGNLTTLRKAMAKQRAYDRTTVNDIVRMARTIIDSGNYNSMTRGEVKRLMGLIKAAAGREDITDQAGKVVDLLIKHQVDQYAHMLRKMVSTRGKKVNAGGVEIQDNLDISGQRTMVALREAMGMDEKQLNTRLGEITDRMGSDDPVVKSNASSEWEGMLLGKQYLDGVKDSVADYKEMQQQLRDARDDYKAGNMTRKEWTEFRKATEDAMRKNMCDRMESYERLLTNVGLDMNQSWKRAQAFKKENQMRVAEIHHNANSDLEGKPADEHMLPTTKMEWQNKSALRIFMSPLATFDYMMRFFGGYHPRGEGYLFNRFMTAYVNANKSEWKNLHADHKALDAKVSEVLGEKTKWSHLFDLEKHMPGMEVEFYDGGEKKKHMLTQGNMLYIYMVNKMPDGKMKLRKMGITEEDVAAIKENIHPKFIQLGDWLQEEYLPMKRREFNAVHERMFGAQMADIEDYFPLKINTRGLDTNLDVAHPDYGDTNPSTITGAIIKRTRNARPLDVMRADAFDVVLEHLQEMEHWAAWAEFNRDLNTLNNYKRFRNRVENMGSWRYGSGKRLWDIYYRTCNIVSDAYHPSTWLGSADTAAVNIAKLWTVAKISLRVYTALKQLLSYPAYFSEASVKELAKSTNPYGAWKAWFWAIDELPGFAERWLSRTGGDNRLMKTTDDFKVWQSKAAKIFSEYGMIPNALVDAITVSMGAKAIYETKKKNLIGLGFSEPEAHRIALRDAAISYNETQQSSQNAYLSPMQLDRTALTVLYTMFRNASMGYQRRMMQAMANIGRMSKKGYRGRSEEFIAKQLGRMGLDEDKTKEAAKRVYNRAWYKNIADSIIFAFVMQFFWNLGPGVAYLLFGKDKKKKEDIVEDAGMHALAGPVEGLAGGDVMSDVYENVRTGKDLDNLSFSNRPVTDDIYKAFKAWDRDKYQGANDLFNLLVQTSIGLNPQTLTDWMVAGMDYFDGDPQTEHEFGLLVMRVLEVPQSQLDQIYIDELGMSARQASKLTAEQFAERYAKYKIAKNAPLTSWMYSNWDRREVELRYIKQFEKRRKELIGMGDSPEVNDILQEYKDGEYKNAKLHVDWLKHQEQTNPENFQRDAAAFRQTPEYMHYMVFNIVNMRINKMYSQGMYDQADTLKARLSRALQAQSEEEIGNILYGNEH